MDTLLPLKLPPGMRNTGTVYQSKDRWYSGNFVRFFNGTIQPIGGWVKRTLTGASITGTPNAALAITAITGSTPTTTDYIAIGTSTGKLYVVNNATNVVYDITPAAPGGTTGGKVYVWQFASFGRYLLAAQGLKDIADGGSSGNFLYVWKGDTATAAVRCDSLSTAGGGVSDDPYSVNGVVVTPERFLLALRGATPNSVTYPPTWVP